MTFQKIDNLMGGSLRRAGAAGKVRAAIVADTFLAVVRKRYGAAADRAVVRRFRDGAVTVACGSSALAEEVRLASAELVAETNRRLGSETVQRLMAVT
ncbi:MAG: DciA family protein [bacterium]